MNNTLFAAVFGGELRLRAMRPLFEHPQTAYTLYELAMSANLDPGNLSRMLKSWSSAGFVVVTGKPRAWRYQLSPDPALEPLITLFRQGSKLVEELKYQLSEIPEADIALIFGSMARSEERASSDVDVLVIGDVSELRLNARLKPLSREIGRPINASVYSADQIKKLAAEQDTFLSNILDNDIIMLKGNLNELKQIADTAGTADGS